MILQFGYFQTGVKTALDREMSGQGPGPRIVYRYQASFKAPGGGSGRNPPGGVGGVGVTSLRGVPESQISRGLKIHPTKGSIFLGLLMIIIIFAKKLTKHLKL